MYKPIAVSGCQPAHAVAQGCKVAVVIPCYKVKRHVLGVIGAIGPEVDAIYCVDDACPQGSGAHVEANNQDARVRVVRHRDNQGVGGATLTGYVRAHRDGADIIVKIDGDGQMDPTILSRFLAPIVRGEADYCKGNRFWNLSTIHHMPWLRRVGNLALSFMAKASTGYWDTFDPTNGYTAIHAKLVPNLPVAAISKRYFFETDLLFRLNTVRAVVVDIPMDAKYGDEVSNLRVSRILGEFAFKHMRNFTKRIFYRYFLRDLSIASFELLAAIAFLSFGVVYGGFHWWLSVSSGQPAAFGTIMLSALAISSGTQLLLAFLGFDIANVPRRPVYPSLPSMAGGE